MGRGLAWLIGRYQRGGLLNRGVRRGVRVHHALHPGAERVRCPYTGRCSAAGLEAARAVGMAALPGIAARMALCGGVKDGEPFDECH